MVATMAAARLACSYLTHHHRTQLRLLGRDDTAEAGLAAFPAKVNMINARASSYYRCTLYTVGAEAVQPEHAAGAPAVADDAGARGAADAARARLLVPVRAGLLHHPHVPRPQPLLLRDELRHDGARHGGHQRPAQPRPGQLPRGGAHAADVRAEVSPGNTTNTSLLKAFYMSK